jgi:hypothetical protein
VTSVETPAVDTEPLGEPSALCSVLSDGEASDALGVSLTIADSTDYFCSWYADFVTSDLAVFISRDVGDLELDAQAVFPDGVALEADGAPAWYTDDVPALYVDIGAGLLFTIELSGTPAEGVDVRSALIDLASLALPRLAAVPLPTEGVEPTEEPEPSWVGDPVLQGLIPAAVGDAEMVIDVFTARDLMAADPNDPGIAAIEDLVMAYGRTIDDVSIGDAYFEGERAYGDLLAIRVAGANVADFQHELTDLILQLLEPVRTPATIGGKEVTVVTDGPRVLGSPEPSEDPFALPLPPSYVYPSGEVLFIVSADEPELSRLFELLP